MESISVFRVGDEAIISINGTEDMLIISGYGVNTGNYYIEIGDARVCVSDVIMDYTDTDFDIHTNTDADIHSDTDADSNTVRNGIKFIVGTADSDAIFAENVRNLIASGGAYDYIVGGDDFIVGGAGNDYINGGNGDDIFIGGTGDDFIDGSAGDDTYYFNVGDGNDSIMDSEGYNTIVFGNGITSDGIKAYRDNWNDLLITFEGVTDTLLIKNYCIDEAARNFKFIFAEGQVYAATDEDSALRKIYDKAGKDYLNGGAGSDTYIYKKGYGTDTFSDSQGTNYIEITGYSVSDVMTFRTNWNDITLVLDGSGEAGLNDDLADKIVLEGFFTSEANRHYYISFNGSVYYATASNSPLRTIYGTVNSDYMQGFDNGNITLCGGAGDDTLNGGTGNDIYIFNVGSGTDTINDNQGVNVIRLGEGLNKDDIVAYRTNWNDLTISFAGIEDKIVIRGYFTSEDNRKFDLIFADGSKFEYSDPESPINLDNVE